MDKAVVVDIWEGIKEFVKEKDRSHVAKNILVTLEEYGMLSEDDMEDLHREGKYLREAVEGIYKDMGQDFDDEDDEFEDEWD